MNFSSKRPNPKRIVPEIVLLGFGDRCFDRRGEDVLHGLLRIGREQCLVERAVDLGLDFVQHTRGESPCVAVDLAPAPPWSVQVTPRAASWPVMKPAKWRTSARFTPSPISIVR